MWKGKKINCCQTSGHIIVYNLLKMVLELLYILPAVTSYKRQIVCKIDLNQHLENIINQQENSPD